jgi:hypothetical protein
MPRRPRHCRCPQVLRRDPTAHPSGEIWDNTGRPVSLDAAARLLERSVSPAREYGGDDSAPHEAADRAGVRVELNQCAAFPCVYLGGLNQRAYRIHNENRTDRATY